MKLVNGLFLFSLDGKKEPKKDQVWFLQGGKSAQSAKARKLASLKQFTLLHVGYPLFLFRLFGNDGVFITNAPYS